ncbi:MAG TPA: ribonuclease Z [Candidatus Diapherotrites archaeon]|uniref:Ribonuclease Z n=1 Tax=Candidatus Iainarchaeum sp. TaxID=3101447 RepID=A0A7J4JEZ2_9ARCH|nr:ribonuclease Z [Candidatus Diapherotrites archaeon]HIH16333.1 ribonuclease Z [Candidatus Diapherotrites archaeon]
MGVKLTFLGSGASAPTKERMPSCLALNFDGQNFLFDCAEGCQRQMLVAGVSQLKIQHVFITHLHADHVLGLPGFIATNSMHLRDYPLYVHGPRGLRERLSALIETGLMRVNYEVIVKEAHEGTILEGKNYSVSAVKLRHDVPCYGYVFQEKGKAAEFQRAWAEKLGIPEGPLWRKLSEGETVEVEGKKFKPEQVLDYSKGRKGKKVCYITDTEPWEPYFEAIREADVLCHEATFLDALKGRARETKHSTAREAGLVAEHVKAKALYLIHLSARHKETQQLENEARMEFANAFAAKDLDEVEL